LESIAFKRSLKNVVKKLVFFSASRQFAIKRRLTYLSEINATIILNLHRVGPLDGSAYEPLSPILFEELIIFSKKLFEITTIRGLRKGSERPKLVLSFDDGYLDFYDHAMPILQRHDICVNHNLIPQCIESGLPPLNIMAQDFVGKVPQTALNNLDVPGFDLPVTKATKQKLSNFIKFKSDAERNALAEYLIPQFEKHPSFSPTPMLTKQHIAEISERHEIGAHSFSHASMEAETDEFVARDAAQCKKYFHSNFSLDVDIFAFPNGSYRAEHLDIVHSAGFNSLLLVDNMVNAPKSIERGIFKRTTFDAQSTEEAVFRGTGAGARAV
jgi:peptidoglycan/xylan/chitin deacetylase (PgdA/CDA1 family)